MGVFEATGFSVSSCDFLADLFENFIALAFADNVSATALAALAFLFVLEMFMEFRNYIWDIVSGQGNNFHANAFLLYRSLYGLAQEEVLGRLWVSSIAQEELLGWIWVSSFWVSGFRLISKISQSSTYLNIAVLLVCLPTALLWLVGLPRNAKMRNRIGKERDTRPFPTNSAVFDISPSG